MMAAYSQMADDLGKHAAREMQIVLNRHMTVAQQVLPPAEMTVMLLNIANGVALGATLYALQVSKDGTDPSDLYDLVAASLPQLMAVGKPTVLQKFAEIGRTGDACD